MPESSAAAAISRMSNLPLMFPPEKTSKNNDSISYHSSALLPVSFDTRDTLFQRRREWPQMANYARQQSHAKRDSNPAKNLGRRPSACRPLPQHRTDKVVRVGARPVHNRYYE